jgi:hypothetical protein
MKKKDSKPRRFDELLKEYDFRGGVRGKYFKRYAAGNNIVVIEPDLARVFPDSLSVNRALRQLVDVARKTGTRQRRKK